MYHFPKVEFYRSSLECWRFGLKVSQRCLDLHLVFGWVCIYWHSWDNGDELDSDFATSMEK